MSARIWLGIATAACALGVGAIAYYAPKPSPQAPNDPWAVVSQTPAPKASDEPWAVVSETPNRSGAAPRGR